MSDQCSLYDLVNPEPDPAAPWARGSETSKAAADEIGQHLGRLEQLVLDAITAHGPQTCDELGAAHGPVASDDERQAARAEAPRPDSGDGGAAADAHRADGGCVGPGRRTATRGGVMKPKTETYTKRDGSTVDVIVVASSLAWAYIKPASGTWKGPELRRVARAKVA